MIDKKDGAIVIHLPKPQELRFKALAELEGLTASEKGLQLIQQHLAEELERFELMKTVFESKQ